MISSCIEVQAVSEPLAFGRLCLAVPHDDRIDVEQRRGQRGHVQPVTAIGGDQGPGSLTCQCASGSLEAAMIGVHHAGGVAGRRPRPVGVDLGAVLAQHQDDRTGRIPRSAVHRSGEALVFGTSSPRHAPRR